MSDEGGLVTSAITITRRLELVDGGEPQDSVTIDTTGDPTLVESLGLLEFAKLHFIAPALADVDDEEGDD